MKNFIVILSLSLGSCVLAQPSFQWVAGMGGTDLQTAESIVTDASGNVITSGLFQFTVDFDPGAGVNNLTAQGGGEVYVQKLDVNGNLLWVRRFAAANSSSTSRPGSICTDATGNIYVSGYFIGTMDCDPGPGTFSITANNSVSFSSSDGFIIKLDPSGNFIWAKQLSGPGNDRTSAIVNDDLGNLMVFGQFESTADFDYGTGTNNLTSNGASDLFIQKLDNLGNFVWANHIGGTGQESAESIAVGPTGEVFLTGAFQSTVDFDPAASTTNLTSLGLYDGFLLKMDNLGNFSWVTQMGGTGQDRGYTLAADAQGNVIVAGEFQNTVDFDPGTGTLNYSSAGAFDGFIQKLDSLGNLIWVNQLAGPNNDRVWSIVADEAGNVLSTGGFTGTVDFAQGPTTFNMSSAGISDVFFQKLDGSTGSNVWAQRIGGTQYDEGTAICKHPNGSIYVGGDYVDFVDFDPGPGVANLPAGEFNGDIFIVKLNCTPSTEVDVQTACSSFTWIDGITYTSSTNSPTVFLTNAQGCDSIVTLNLTIEDATAPIPDISTLSDITAECEVISLTAPTATDNCSATVTVTNDVVLPISTQGTTVVTWTYDDGNGNTSTQTQDVVIADLTAPAADLANLPEINSECEVTPTAPTAADNCTGSITGTPDVSFPITASGTTTITWTYDDGNGNTSIQTQDVIITPIDVTTTTIGTLATYDISANASGYSYQWIENCGTTNDILTGETNQVFTPLTNGVYAVIIDNGTCSDTSLCVVIDDVGVEENDFGASIQVYPNPTESFVNIRFDKARDAHISVLNTLGQIVAEYEVENTNTAQIDLGLEPGHYVLRLNLDGMETSIPVVKL